MLAEWGKLTSDEHFSVDEKSLIQALDRTQPLLPMNFRAPETRNYDYKRHGTTTLFAVLNVATGEVTGKVKRRNPNEDWIRSLRAIDKAVPPGLDPHQIVDNYSAHKTGARNTDCCGILALSFTSCLRTPCVSISSNGFSPA